MIFGNTNAIEPTDAERKRAKEAPPIREATDAELAAAATQRSAREAAPAVKAVSASTSTAPAADPVAERHGLYTAEHLGGRRYYADYQQKSEVMRASKFRISSRLDDKQTISAMVDLAETRGWQSVKLSGSESFRREAWVQASLRGVATEGYTPWETDRQELVRRQNAMERPATTAKAEAAQPAKAVSVTASKPAAAEAQQARAQDRPEQAAAAEAAPKAGRHEIANGWTERKAEAVNRRIAKREGERTLVAEPSAAAMRKVEAAADPTRPMHEKTHEHRADAHVAEAGVWNSVEARGAEAMAHRAGLKEKADAARAQQEERALAARAAAVRAA